MRIKLSFLCLVASVVAAEAQTVKSQVVEDGGTGPYAAVVVADQTLPDFTIYRPGDLKAAVEKEGRLPIILYGNGGCANDNQQMRYLLNEVVSYGYVAIAIGPYDEEDVDANWHRVFHPEDAAKTKSPAPHSSKGTDSSQLLEAMDWITRQWADPQSEYYHMVNLDKVVAMGQSCGGAQALSISYDPRIKTTIMMNSGMGDISMAGASKACLENLHAPIFYIIGGPTDIAYENALMDFGRIHDVPAVMINTTEGHHGTYWKSHGGEYAIAIRKWLDWQLKGNEGQAALFLDPEYIHEFFPEWTLKEKYNK